MDTPNLPLHEEARRLVTDHIIQLMFVALNCLRVNGHELVTDCLEQSEVKTRNKIVKGFDAHGNIKHRNGNQCKTNTFTDVISPIACPNIKLSEDKIPELKGGTIRLNIKNFSNGVLPFPPVDLPRHVADTRVLERVSPIQPRLPDNTDINLSVQEETVPASFLPIPEASVAETIIFDRPSTSRRMTFCDQDVIVPTEQPADSHVLGISFSQSGNTLQDIPENNTDTQPLSENAVHHTGTESACTVLQPLSENAVHHTRPESACTVLQPLSENAVHHTRPLSQNKVKRSGSKIFQQKHLRFEVDYEQVGTVTLKLFVPNSGIGIDKDKLKAYEVTLGETFKIHHDRSMIEVNFKNKPTKGAKVKILNCIRCCGNILEYIQLPVLVIDNIFDYHNELLVKGLNGAYPQKGVKFINVQFGTYIYNVDLFDFYVYGIVALVDEQGTDLYEIWPWRNENGDPIEPPDNEKVSYKDLVNSITDQESFFHLLGKANSGQFLTDTSNASHLVCKIILAMTYSEVIRNHWALIDNIYLFDSKARIENIKSFLPKWYPMMALGTFHDRKTGFDGITAAYRKRKEVFYNRWVREASIQCTEN